jgi:hypothetical protein
VGTVANGWYLAWWPGTVAASGAEVSLRLLVGADTQLTTIPRYDIRCSGTRVR